MIDVFKIAQDLLNELVAKQEADKLRAEGVVLLFDRLKEAAVAADEAARAEAAAATPAVIDVEAK